VGLQMGDRFVRGPWGGGGGGSGTPRAAGTLRDPGTPRGSGTPRAHGTPRAFAPARRMNLSELATGLFFISLIAYFGYDGFNQIFTKPEPCEPPVILLSLHHPALYWRHTIAQVSAATLLQLQLLLSEYLKFLPEGVLGRQGVNACRSCAMCKLRGPNRGPGLRQRFHDVQSNRRRPRSPLQS